MSLHLRFLLAVVGATALLSVEAGSTLIRPAPHIGVMRTIVGLRESAGVSMLSKRLLEVASIPRGGAAMDEGNNEDEEDDLEGDDAEEDDDLEDDDDEDDVGDDDDEDDDTALDYGEFAESDFVEKTDFDHFLAAWKSTPPLTKGYLSASLAATLYGCLMGRNEFPSLLTLDWTKVVTRLQIWRPFTAFLNFGPLGLGYLMTVHFTWLYMSSLERLNHNRPYDFWIMILFGQLCMVIGYPLLRLRTSFLGHNLITFLVYIWSRYHEGIEVNMYGLFNARAELLPWMLLAETFLLVGEPPILDVLGICFGHLYHRCKTVGILRAPKSLTKWYENSEGVAKHIRELYKPISSDFDAP